MDKYEIYIYKDIDWEIRAKGLESYDDVPPYDNPTPQYRFGIMRIFPNGKIAYLFDISSHNEDLEIAKEDKMMQEVCSFDITIIPFIGKSTVEQKEMSIYEALLYIENKQKEMRDEH